MEKNIKDIIGHYLQNTISQDELDFLISWVSMKENESRFREAIAAYYGNGSFDAKKAYKRFEATVLSKGSEVPKWKKHRSSLMRYAAVFVGIAIAGYVVYLLAKPAPMSAPETEVTLEVEGGGNFVLKESGTKNIATDKGKVLATQQGSMLRYDDSSDTVAKPIYNVLRVPYGKTFRLLLSDGSVVYLNAGSSLKFPARFAKGAPREVVLGGEGYFKVSKDKTSPFIVRANGASTQVFGTEFNISSYKEDYNTQIVLVQGSIGVFDKGGRFDPHTDVLLKPNEMASVGKRKDISVQPVDVDGHIAWVRGTLFFKNEDFASIARKLQRHYNVSITNNFKILATKKFTGRFDIETVEQILQTFQKTNHFNYTINGNNIVIDA